MCRRLSPGERAFCVAAPGSAFGSRLLVTLHALFLSPSVYACGHIEFGTLLLPRRLQRGGGKVAINKAFCDESQEGSSLSRSPLSPTSQQFGNYHARTVFKQSTGVTYVRWHEDLSHLYNDSASLFWGQST